MLGHNVLRCVRLSAVLPLQIRRESGLSNLVFAMDLTKLVWWPQRHA